MLIFSLELTNSIRYRMCSYCCSFFLPGVNCTARVKTVAELTSEERMLLSQLVNESLEERPVKQSAQNVSVRRTSLSVGCHTRRPVALASQVVIGISLHGMRTSDRVYWRENRIQVRAAPYAEGTRAAGTRELCYDIALSRPERNALAEGQIFVSPRRERECVCVCVCADTQRERSSQLLQSPGTPATPPSRGKKKRTVKKAALAAMIQAQARQQQQQPTLQLSQFLRSLK
jgi:hypothetical protein